MSSRGPQEAPIFSSTRNFEIFGRSKRCPKDVKNLVQDLHKGVQKTTQKVSDSPFQTAKKVSMPSSMVRTSSSFSPMHNAFLHAKKLPKRKQGGDLSRHNLIFPPTHDAKQMKNPGHLLETFLDTFLKRRGHLLDTFLETSNFAWCQMWTPFGDLCGHLFWTAEGVSTAPHLYYTTHLE